MSCEVLLNEFEIIERYFNTAEFQCDRLNWVIRGNGDDAAVLRVPEGMELVCSVDTLVADRHFPEASAAFDVGYRSLAVAVSDLAAMGASPAGFFLAMSLPNNQACWVSGFADGLLKASRAFQIPLLGGDTTQGPLTITLHVQGWVPRGCALLRSGAQSGDRIFVSGYLGQAAAALSQVIEEPKPNTALKRCYFQPSPRIALGEKLRGLASACIDISDGLLQDLEHICRSSGVSAHIDFTALPLCDQLKAAADHAVSVSDSVFPETVEAPMDNLVRWMLAGGDDYELCFTVPESKVTEVRALLVSLSLPGTDIGVIAECSSVPSGSLVQVEGLGEALKDCYKKGFLHFT